MVLDQRGYFTEGRQRLEGALSASEETFPDIEIQALVGLMHLTLFQGDVAASRAFAARCLSTARRAGDLWAERLRSVARRSRVGPRQLRTLHCSGDRGSSGSRQGARISMHTRRSH